MSQETFLLQLKFNLQKKQTKKKTIKVKSLATMVTAFMYNERGVGGIYEVWTCSYFTPEAHDDITRASEKKREEMTIYKHSMFHLLCFVYWRRQKKLSEEHF